MATYVASMWLICGYISKIPFLEPTHSAPEVTSQDMESGTLSCLLTYSPCSIHIPCEGKLFNDCVWFMALYSVVASMSLCVCDRSPFTPMNSLGRFLHLWPSKHSELCSHY